MPFDLRLTISGLCLFARDEQSKQMHVLMPATERDVKGCGGGQMYIPAHVAWLLYDRQYETGSSPGKQFAAVPIDGVSQVLSNGGVNCADTELSPTVADIGAAAGASVPGKYATMPIAPPLATRLTLSAGAAVGCAGGACWNLGKLENQEMTSAVHWMIAGVPGTTLALSTAHGYKILNAVAGAIDIGIYCVPPTDLPGMPDPNAPLPLGAFPPHFAAFYTLCTSPSIQCPTYKGNPEGGLDGMVHIAGTNPMTCLVATAPLEW